ncbi:glycosyltransferase, partial [Candidatus Parcubacteria bacterium]|nr:glycosyltransferase [Candidatus Parcubacteria bacterium]
KPMMATIIEKYPQVQFIYIGHGGVPTDDLYAKFIYGDDLFEEIPKERRESMLPAMPGVWPYILASLQADIAIAPLEKNYFNSFKTQCKYLEYAVNGLPGVYSKWFYTDVEGGLVLIPNIPPVVYGGTTGLVADTPEEWIDALSILIENATLRRTIGEKAREAVIEDYDFARHAPRWQGFVESVGHESSYHSPPSTS